MIAWFAQRPPEEDPVDTDELACLYQIASPLRRAYVQVTLELDEAFSDAETQRIDGPGLRRKWETLLPAWLARLAPPPLDEAARQLGLARMEAVRAAVPVTDTEDDIGDDADPRDDRT